MNNNLLDTFLTNHDTNRYQVFKDTGIAQSTLQNYSKKEFGKWQIIVINTLAKAVNISTVQAVSELIELNKKLEEKSKMINKIEKKVIKYLIPKLESMDLKNKNILTSDEAFSFARSIVPENRDEVRNDIDVYGTDFLNKKLQEYSDVYDAGIISLYEAIVITTLEKYSSFKTFKTMDANVILKELKAEV